MSKRQRDWIPEPPRPKTSVGIVCRLSELNLGPLDALSSLYTTYVYVLAVNPQIGQGPYRMQVTDFTHNNQLSFMEYAEPQFSLSSRQILRLDCYPEKFHALRRRYERDFGAELVHVDGNEVPYQDVSRRLCLLKVNYKVKFYNSQLEGRVYAYDLITCDDSDWDSSSQLQALGKLVIRRALDLGEREMLSKVVPAAFLQESSMSSNLTIASEDHSTQLRPSQRSQLTAKIEPRAKHPSPQPLLEEQVPVKQEELNGFVPDDKFEADLEDDGPSQVPDSLLSNEVMTQAQPVSPHDDNSSSGGIPFADSLEVVTLDKLKNMDCVVDNKVYTVEVEVVGISPEEASYVCAKGYEAGKGHDADKLSLTDPRVRSIELYVCGVHEHQQKRQKRSFLGPEDYLKVHITADQLKSDFGVPVELLYAKPEILAQKLASIRGSIRTMRLYKTNLALNGNCSVVVWTTKSI